MENLIIEGTAFYAQIHTPSQMYNRYSTDLVVSSETQAQLEGLGLSVAKRKVVKTIDGEEVEVKVAKSYEEQGHPGAVFSFGQKALKEDGTPLRKPIVVDATNTPIGDLIGNGSKVRLKIAVGEYNFKGKKGITSYLNGMQVLELVPYMSNNGFGVVEGGFKGTKAVETVKTESPVASKALKSDSLPF